MITLLLSLIFAHSAYANVMNLNEFMPTRVEDASVSDLNEVEIQGSLDYVDQEEKFLFRPNFRWGASDQVQLEFSSDHISAPSKNEDGHGSITLGGQWQFMQENTWKPSLSLEPQADFPTGKNTYGVDPSMRFIMTKTISGSLKDPLGQIHFNYRYLSNSDRQSSEDSIGQLLIMGYSHSFGAHTALVMDYVNEKSAFKSSVQNEVELGWIHEIFDNTNLGVGIALDVNQGYYSSIISSEFHI